VSESFSKEDIIRLFHLLNDELLADNISGELYVVGGAVMSLVYDERESTRDVDAYFLPATKIRHAAQRVAVNAGISEDWLNDGVKRFLSDKGQFDCFLELSNLKVLCAQAEYLLAMKCLAMRIGDEFHDLDDIRYLLRFLNITSLDRAYEIIGQYYPIDRFPQKTMYALEELVKK